VAKQYSGFRQLQIKCSKEQAKEIENLFAELNQSNSIVIEPTNDDNSYGHWLEYVNIGVTIIASSITIIDTILKWLKKKKDDDQNQITINFNQFNYNLTELNQLEIELNEMKKQISDK